MSEAFHSMSQRDIECDGEKDYMHGPYSTQQYLFCNLYYKNVLYTWVPRYTALIILLVYS